MQVEYEATFPNINKDEIRMRLRNAGASLMKAEFLQKRVVFSLPKGHEIEGGWLRVRDEGDKVTMSLKVVNNSPERTIEDQKETQLQVDDFEKAESFLISIGCQKKAYQESRREIWMMDDVEICLDEWPFLEPYVEIEADNEEKVKRVVKALGFDYAQALFCSVDTLYNLRYGVSENVINNQTPIIKFEMNNPFK